MKRNLLASLIIWFVFMNLAPVGLEITRNSTIGNILQYVEPFNNSDNITTESPSLIEGILKARKLKSQIELYKSYRELGIRNLEEAKIYENEVEISD